MLPGLSRGFYFVKGTKNVNEPIHKQNNTCGLYGGFKTPPGQINRIIID